MHLVPETRQLKLDVWWFPSISYCKELVHHPIETTTNKWMFEDPGCLYKKTHNDIIYEVFFDTPIYLEIRGFSLSISSICFQHPLDTMWYSRKKSFLFGQVLQIPPQLAGRETLKMLKKFRWMAELLWLSQQYPLGIHGTNGIFYLHEWLIFMVNVSRYIIHQQETGSSYINQKQVLLMFNVCTS